MVGFLKEGSFDQRHKGYNAPLFKLLCLCDLCAYEWEFSADYQCVYFYIFSHQLSRSQQHEAQQF